MIELADEYSPWLFDRAPLTEAQHKVYRATLAFWKDHGRPPSIREVSAITKTSPNAVCLVVATLRDRKYIAEGSITPYELHQSAKDDAATMLDHLPGATADRYDHHRKRAVA